MECDLYTHQQKRKTFAVTCQQKHEKKRQNNLVNKGIIQFKIVTKRIPLISHLTYSILFYKKRFQAYVSFTQSFEKQRITKIYHPIIAFFVNFMTKCDTSNNCLQDLYHVPEVLIFIIEEELLSLNSAFNLFAILSRQYNAIRASFNNQYSSIMLTYLETPSIFHVNIRYTYPTSRRSNF